LMAGEITVINRHWPPVKAFMGRSIYLVLPHPRWVIYGLNATTHTTRFTTCSVQTFLGI
jgi:hypothetical protein